MQEQRHQGEEGAAGIAGLRYVPEFITTEEEDALVRSLEQLDWNNPLPRRTHHFGYMYDFTSRRGAIEEHPRVPVPSEPFPDWLRQLAARLCESGAMPHVPDQVIANEYTPGQGLGFHIDNTQSFDSCVVSLTLQSGCAMDFKHKDSKHQTQVYLERRSLLVLEGDARYAWMHAVARRTEDVVGDTVIPRGTRLSLTFRRVLDQAKPAP